MTINAIVKPIFTDGTIWLDRFDAPVVPITWQKDVGVEVTPTTIKKVSGTTGWNAQAYSDQSLTGGCYLEFKASQVDKDSMLSINTDPATNSSYLSLDFTIRTHSSGIVYLFESGVNLGNFGAYTPDTLLAIHYNNADIIYYKDGVEIHRTVAVGAGLTFYVDSSFYSVGGEANSIKFSAPQAILAPNVTTRLNSTAYSVGEIVNHSGLFHRCIRAGVSGAVLPSSVAPNSDEIASKLSDIGSLGLLTYSNGILTVTADGGYTALTNFVTVPQDPAGYYRYVVKLAATTTSGLQVNDAPNFPQIAQVGAPAGTYTKDIQLTNPAGQSLYLPQNTSGNSVSISYLSIRQVTLDGTAVFETITQKEASHQPEIGGTYTGTATIVGNAIASSAGLRYADFDAGVARKSIKVKTIACVNQNILRTRIKDVSNRLNIAMKATGDVSILEQSTAFGYVVIGTISTGGLGVGEYEFIDNGEGITTIFNGVYKGTIPTTFMNTYTPNSLANQAVGDILGSLEVRAL